MTSVRPRKIYEDNKTYPILVKMGGYHRIVEMSGKQANKDTGMIDMEKLKELYRDPRHEILSEMARLLDSSRIWGGMEYVYHPIHPVKYLPLRNKVAEELRTLAMEHGIYE